MEVASIWQQIVYPHYILHFRACLFQRSKDIFQSLIALLHHVCGDWGSDVVVPIPYDVSDEARSSGHRMRVAGGSLTNPVVPDTKTQGPETTARE